MITPALTMMGQDMGNKSKFRHMGACALPLGNSSMTEAKKKSWQGKNPFKHKKN
jgi:hypothetical protein